MFFILIVLQEQKGSHQFMQKSKNMRFHGTEFFIQSTPLKYTNINSYTILFLFNRCANRQDFELQLHYSFRHRIGTGRPATYQYRNDKSILTLVSLNLI